MNDRSTPPESEIRLAREGAVGRMHLDRPRALNSLTLEMIRAMAPQLDAWSRDPDVAAVLVTGEGDKAFCAGGDVRALYESRTRGDTDFRATFYREEYHLNRDMFRFPKPYVAAIDGIVMGGGVGISVHGSHRVVTERTMFAMPETGIGLFPDVGGGHFLPRCPGELGMYLGLTGARLGAADCVYAGVATHYVPSAALPGLIEALCAGAGSPDSVDRIIAAHAGDPGPAPLAERRADIDRLFAADTVTGVLEALAREEGEWAAKTLAGLRTKSPLSLHLTFRQLREGGKLDFEDVMVMEYRLSQRCMAGHDFFEGVRAVIVDKDNRPRWQHRSVEEVTTAEVDAYFAPLGAADLIFT